MKICLINNLYKPYNRGGAESIVELIANGFKEAGHEVFIITTKPVFKSKVESPSNSAGRQKSKVYHINGLYFNLGKLPKFLRLVWHLIDMFDIGSYFRVKKILKKERPDIVMTHNLKGISYLIPRLIKNLNIKYAHTLHDTQLLHPSGLMFYRKEENINGLFARIYQGLCRFLFSSPNVVISPSEWLMGEHTDRRFFRDSKKVVLPNPAPTPSLSPVPTSRERGVKKTPFKIPLNPPLIKGARGEACPPVPGYGRRGGFFRFLYVGQIEDHKGVLFLIKTFKLFCDEIKNKKCKLLIVGDGSKVKKAKKLIPKLRDKNIELFGKKSNEEVMRLMQSSDCLIVPSLCYENSPTVIYEAFSAGLPVIASRIGGIPELLKNKKGLLFKPSNEGDLMYNMKWIMEHRDEFQEMAGRGERKIEEFGVRGYVERLMNLLN